MLLVQSNKIVITLVTFLNVTVSIVSIQRKHISFSTEDDYYSLAILFVHE